MFRQVGIQAGISVGARAGGQAGLQAGKPLLQAGPHVGRATCKQDISANKPVSFSVLMRFEMQKAG